MNVTRLNIDSPAWGAFVARRPAATAFHHPAWAQFLAACYGYQPYALVLNDGSGSIVAGLPVLEVRSWLTGRRLVSLPFTDCCPPLATDDTALRALTQALAAHLAQPGASRLEVRAPLPAMPGVYLSSDAVSHRLALSPDAEAVFRTFKKKRVQQRVRKAEQAEVAVRRGKTRADLDAFYHMHVLTRQRLGVPVQPKRFFDLLWQRLIEGGLGFLLIAYAGSVPIASAVFLVWNGTVIYKHSASDRAHWHLRPNNLILWRAIQWGCEHGCHTFDLGRSDLADEGLRGFKSGWGATEEALVYSTIGRKPPRPHGRGIERGLSLVIRHTPPLVCRAIGEVLYAHAA